MERAFLFSVVGPTNGNQSLFIHRIVRSKGGGFEFIRIYCQLFKRSGAGASRKSSTRRGTLFRDFPPW